MPIGRLSARKTQGLAPEEVLMVDVARRTRAEQMMPVTAENLPQLHGMVTELSQRMAIQPPAIFLYDNATGPFQAMAMSTVPRSIAISKNMFEALDPEELKAVVGHELAHVTTYTPEEEKKAQRSRSIKLGAVGIGAYLGAKALGKKGNGWFDVALLGSWALLSFAPGAIAGSESRKNELEADADSVNIGGANPVALVSALAKTKEYYSSQPRKLKDTIKGFITKPIQWLNRSHPSLDARMDNLDVTADDVAAYRGGIEIPAIDAPAPQPTYAEHPPHSPQRQAPAPGVATAPAPKQETAWSQRIAAEEAQMQAASQEAKR